MFTNEKIEGSKVSEVWSNIANNEYKRLRQNQGYYEQNQGYVNQYEELSVVFLVQVYFFLQGSKTIT